MASDEHTHVLEGLILPKFVIQENLDILKEMELFPDDIWIVSYPKCGTTWLTQIVRCILGKKGDETKLLDQAVPYIEAANSKTKWFPYNVDFSALERPRAFKTHMPYYRIVCGKPHKTPCKYIYITRNPKDAAVSLFHHFNSGLDNWEEFCSYYLSENSFYSGYFDHVLSWWENRNHDNILFLTYEDLKLDVRSSISQIAEFMGHKLSSDEIEAVVEKSSFSYMKENPTTNYDWINKGFFNSDSNPFIRKGIVGGWQDWFSAEQSAQYDTVYFDKLQSKGLELKFT